jgi:hypothetical protein
MMIFLTFLLLLRCAKSAIFNQSFDSPDLKFSNASNRTLSDQSQIIGSALVNVNGSLQLTSFGQMNQKGEYSLPAMIDSSLGWRLNFTAKLRAPNSGSAGEGFGVVWGNVSLLAENRNLLSRTNSSTGRGGRFAAWTVDTYSNPGPGDQFAKTGFYIFNNSGTRDTDISRNITLPKDFFTVSFFIAWNPEGGATFTTTKPFPNQNSTVNIVDRPIVFDGNDSFGWWFVAETTNVTQSVLIDDIHLDVPCGECRGMNGTCIWLESSYFECLTPSTEETTTTTAMPTFPTSTITTTAIQLSVVTEALSVTTTSSDVVLQTIDSNNVMFSATEFGAIVGIVVGVIVLLVVLLVAMVAWRRCDGSESSTDGGEELKAAQTGVYGSLAAVQQSTTATTTKSKENESQPVGGIYSNASVLGERSTLAESNYEPVTSPL